MDSKTENFEVNTVALAVDNNYLLKLSRVFRKEIAAIVGLNHITIHLILPNKESICLTSSHEIVTDYVKNEYGEYDHSLIKRYTDNLPFYSWEVCPLNKSAEKLNKIKKDRYSLHSGMNFVRHIDNFTLIYSVATFIEDPVMQFVMISKANQILEIGDYLYNTFHKVYQQHANIEIPKVDTFTPFTGGIEGIIPNYEYADQNNRNLHLKNFKHQVAQSDSGLRLMKNEILEGILSDEKHKNDTIKTAHKKPFLYIVK